MTAKTPRSVRSAYLGLLLGLTVFTLVESALGRAPAPALAAEGLSTCGTEAVPCALEPLAVVAEPAPDPVRLAEGLSACGSENQPCMLEPIAVEAEPVTARLASVEVAPRMTVRAGS